MTEVTSVPVIERDQFERRFYAHDASHYLLYPEGIAHPQSIQDIETLFDLAHSSNISLTFRAGGTSLSGQGVTRGLLVDCRRAFRGVRLLDPTGERVEILPGTTVRYANAVLARKGRILGPDPASEISATIGGVVANNSSGMACGTRYNAYSMLDSLTFTLPSGTTISTGAPDADERLRAMEPELYSVLEQIRDELRDHTAACAEVERLFAMKNTMGYGMNSFLDFDRPIDILEHVLVGSEGTLAFISSVVFNTKVVQPLRSVALIVMDTLEEACDLVTEIEQSGASAIELIEARGLRVAQSFPDVPRTVKQIDVKDHAALLVEYRGQDAGDLAAKVAAGKTVLAKAGTPAVFTTGATEIEALWRVRKGLYTTVASARAPGTTALLEDVAVPLKNLARLCARINELFDEYGYADGVIFGHAKDGNIHFMVTDDFSDEGAKTKFGAFTDSMAEAVLGLGGVLKAEHGTGRVMAPFVQRQYGDFLYSMMWRLKRACDPHGILNPGVILSEDSTAHLQDFKPMPVCEPLVDRCVECGYCEPSCPSEDVTLTPRGRIVMLRERQMASNAKDQDLVAAIDDKFGYQGVDTCAVDGLCKIACPVGIDTGDLTRQLREERMNRPLAAGWTRAAVGWAGVTRVAAALLNILHRLPSGAVRGLTQVGRAILGKDVVPLWSADIPKGGKRRARLLHDARNADVVYFPTCLSALFAGADGDEPEDDFLYLCEQAGITVRIPEGIDALCCSTPWSSKGLRRGKEAMHRKLVKAIAVASRGGRLPVVCDASSCTEGIRKALRDAPVTLIDAPQFLADEVLPRLRPVRNKVPSLTLHPSCSSKALGSDDALFELGQAIAKEVHVPVAWGCCAFAGDRGLLHPELTEGATKREAVEVMEIRASHHASSNRTCEIGMSRATGEEYVGIVSMLAHAIRSSR